MPTVDVDAIMAAWREGDYYPLPCARCGDKMLRKTCTAIYPHDGMICAKCAKEVTAELDEAHQKWLDAHPSMVKWLDKHKKKQHD